jgi:hypothetical protein
MTMSRWILVVCAAFGLLQTPSSPAAHTSGSRKTIQILFLGHNSKHHDSARFGPMLFKALEADDITFTYTAEPNDLNSATLAKYDGVMIYANHDTITPEQKSAAGFCGRRQGISAHPRGFVLLQEFARLRRARWCAVPESWHRRVHGHHRENGSSGDGRHSAIRGVGRDLRAHHA